MHLLKNRTFTSCYYRCKRFIEHKSGSQSMPFVVEYKSGSQSVPFVVEHKSGSQSVPLVVLSDLMTLT